MIYRSRVQASLPMVRDLYYSLVEFERVQALYAAWSRNQLLKALSVPVFFFPKKPKSAIETKCPTP